MSVWQAPFEASCQALDLAPEMSFQRLAFSPDLGICRVIGHAPRPLDLYAPPQDGPRLHLQFLRRGGCRLINEAADAVLNQGTGRQLLTPGGDVVWRTDGREPLDVLSVDLALDPLARQLDIGLADLTAWIAALGPENEDLLIDLRHLAMLLNVGKEASVAGRLALQSGVLSTVSRWIESAGLEQQQEKPRSDLVDVARAAILRGKPPQSVSALAREAGCSARRLSDAYRKRFGASLFQDLLDARMRFAARMLAATDSPIKQIAWAAGYETPAAFSQAFHRHFGVTPQQIRCGTLPLSRSCKI